MNMDYCFQYDCKEYLYESFICESCNKTYCKNCIYLICSICHKRFACFSCGSKERILSSITGYCKFKSNVTAYICCKKHMDQKYEKNMCEQINCTICKKN